MASTCGFLNMFNGDRNNPLYVDIKKGTELNGCKFPFKKLKY